TDLTDESGGWVGLTGVEGTDHQVMSLSSEALTIGTAEGNIASGVVTVTVYYANPSDTIYICSKVEAN
ncbi:MAG: hypothetical protein DRI46_10865, partial [Chloroflexi bacterium]